MKELIQNVKIPSNSSLNSEVKFPVALLPNWFKNWADEHSRSYGTPIELWATAGLSAIAAATGKRYKLVTDNYTNYPQLWIMIVGMSGTGKSDALKVSFNRLNQINEANYQKYQSDYNDWESAEKQGVAPRWKQILINDTTPEALYSTLQKSPDGLTLYRDELSGWFEDIGRYNKSGEVGHYLSIFNNQTFSANRKSDKPILISDPCFNIVGSIQPSMLKKVLEKNNAEGSGFAQRFLFLYPDFPPRKYNRKAVDTSTIEFYNKMIDAIVNNGGENEVFLNDEAENVYESFFNEMEQLRSQADEFWSATYSKAQIQVLRLALTIKIARLVEDGDDIIKPVDMNCAIEMQRFFIESVRKFRDENETKIIKKSDLIREAFKINPGASQAEIAKVFNVTQQYVSKVMKNET